MPCRHSPRVRGTLTLLTAWTILASSLLYAQATTAVDPCDPTLARATKDPLAYGRRGDRCEGLYIKEVAGSGGLQVASFVESGTPFEIAQRRAPAGRVVAARRGGGPTPGCRAPAAQVLPDGRRARSRADLRVAGGRPGFAGAAATRRRRRRLGGTSTGRERRGSLRAPPPRQGRCARQDRPLRAEGGAGR